MTQCERLLAHLKTGARINPFRAWRKLGIYRLGARIYDLRQQGHMIDEQRIKVGNRFGEQCRVSEYRLAMPEDERARRELLTCFGLPPTMIGPGGQGRMF